MAPGQQQESLTLQYLNIKGLAEPVRLALFLGGVAFADERVTYEDVAAMRAADAGKGAVNPTGQVPVLSIDGVPFSQSSALLRWVGKRTGLYPDGLQQLRVDVVEETLKDLRQVFAPLWYGNCMSRNPRSGELPAGTALSDEQRAEVLRLINADYLPARVVA